MNALWSRRGIGTVAGLAALGLGAFAYVVYGRDIRAARARIESGSQVAATRCGPIEYAIAGQGSPDLVNFPWTTNWYLSERLRFAHSNSGSQMRVVIDTPATNVCVQCCKTFRCS